MQIQSYPKIARIITLALFFIGIPLFLFCQEPEQYASDNRGYAVANKIPERKKGTVVFKGGELLPKSMRGNLTMPQEEENLSKVQQEARMYRMQGLDAQNIGDLGSALSFYQKAVELDPAYSVAYNDLGVIYEAMGDMGRAEESYLKAIKIDPHYLSSYSNLALLYENERDLMKAAFYWKKRVDLGLPDDPWTAKAQARLDDINMVLSNKPFQNAREQDVVGLIKDVGTQKSLQRKDNKELAKFYFDKARLSFKKGDEVAALKMAIDAGQLDPDNAEIQAFIEKLQTRVLSR